MNIAILIGVSKYKNFNNLSQCKNDVKIMRGILEKSSKYDDILCIDNNTSSGNIFNNDMDNFISKYEGKKINEILFYFSGHGVTKDNDFYFCTTNTDEDRINATSISNKNLDSLIRKLNPNLFVKIIDACESGLTYVKGVSKREELLEQEKGTFKNCYFFSSSQNNQSSYIKKNQKFSDFTFSFVNIIKRKFIDEKKEIKYRDMSNELADLSLEKDQTPFFIEQGSLSEIFLPYSFEIVEVINKHLIDNNKKGEEDEIIKESNDEINEEIAINFKEQIISSLENKLKHNSKTLKENKYQLNLSYESDNTIPRNKICDWIIKNKEKYYIFANPKSKTVLKKDKMFGFFHSDEDYITITDDFSVNVDDNYQIKINYISSKKNYPMIKCHIICLYSLTKIYMFYSFSTSVPNSWDTYDEYKSDGMVKYKVFNIDNINDCDETVKELSDEFKNYADTFINKYIEILF